MAILQSGMALLNRDNTFSGDNTFNGASAVNDDVTLAAAKKLIGLGDITLKLPDAAGANKFSILGSDDVLKASIDSAGNLDANTFHTLDAATGGTNCMFAGEGAAGSGNNTGTENTGIGYLALEDVTSGGQNTALGAYALRNLTIGTYNVAIGRSALIALTEGTYNFALGSGVLTTATTAGSNVGIGTEALKSTNASGNIAIGSEAGKSTTGALSVFIGYRAGRDADASNVLYIANSQTATPLIFGDFSAPSLTFNGAVTLQDARDITVGTTTGTKIGTAADQKLGFFNAAPVVQQAHIVDANGQLADITTKFNTLLAQMATLGFQAAA